MKANVHPITIISGGMGKVRLDGWNRVEAPLRFPLQVEDEQPVLSLRQSTPPVQSLAEVRSGQKWETLSYAALGAAGICGIVLGFL